MLNIRFVFPGCEISLFSTGWSMFGACSFAAWLKHKQSRHIKVCKTYSMYFFSLYRRFYVSFFLLTYILCLCPICEQDANKKSGTFNFIFYVLQDHYILISRRVTYYLCALNIFVIHKRRSSAFAKKTSNTKNATNSAKKRELPWSRNSTARSSKNQKMLTNWTRPVRADFQKKHVPKARKTQGFARVCHFDLQS